MDKKVIWLGGNLSEGFRACGPYDSMDMAFDAHDGEDGWAMTLNEPATPEDRPLGQEIVDGNEGGLDG